MEYEDLIKLIETRFGWKKQEVYPRLFNDYAWRPKLIFYNSANDIYIATDVIFDQQFSKKIYKNESVRLLRQHANVRVCLFSPLDSEYKELKAFCKKYGFGLKIYGEKSINTIRPFKSEKVEKITRKKIRKKGWFPQIILSEIKKITNLEFKDQLIELAKKLERTQNKAKQLAFINTCINKMLKIHPDYLGNNIPFMRLSSLENLLNFSDVDYKDHVFHSARVFLIGCLIINRYYDKFQGYYKDVLGTDMINIEYIWLLASLFHDIGRVKQDAYRIYLSDPATDNPQLKEELEAESIKDWQKEEFKTSLGNIIELIKQSSKNKRYRSKPFVGFALGAIDEKMAIIFREHYNKLTSHGVIGCFELSTDLLRKAKASNYENNPFFLYHIFPAVLAIALHDWKIWKELREAKIFPINICNYPFAALLIYIDTWDDYKREADQKITIDGIDFQEKGVTVNLTWHKTDEYLDEKLKYDLFERNVLFGDLRLKIEVSNKKIK